ncbi:unnamed protein product [Rotaria sp. Silwood1]|nr:unnamed protein product [Rotaria sp. Silwood1]CAF1675675.1 unnamed protein product [Rotaria sp. Silwood1]
MTTQSSLFEKFLAFMHETLNTNKALIEQKSRLYELALQNEKTMQFFLDRADQIVILDANQLIEIGMKKVTELNVESVSEMKNLQTRLQEVLGDTKDDTTNDPSCRQLESSKP